MYKERQAVQSMHEKPPVPAQSLPFSFRSKPGPSGSSLFWANIEDSSLPAPYIRPPDTTCTSECTYDGKKDPQPQGGYPLRGTDGYLSGQHRAGANPVETPIVIPAHSPTESNLMASTSDPVRVVTHELSAP